MLLAMSDGTIRRTWEERQLPLLQAIARAEEEYDGSRRPLNSLGPWLREASGLDDRDVQLGLRALYEADYVSGNEPGINGRMSDLIGIRLLERGRRTVGQWPPEAALGVGRDVLTSVLSAWARGQFGL